MIVNVLLLMFLALILFCIGKRVLKTKALMNNTFLTKENTGNLKGIAILGIAFAHIIQYEPTLKNTLLGGKYSYLVVFSWGAIGVAIFFLLSGYGCFLSIKKSTNNLQWALKHIVKMLLYFVITYFLVVFTRIVLLGEMIEIMELFESFFMLKLPGTSSWYFKIQILFYILLAISDKLKKNQCYFVTLLVLLYAIVANACGFPDYWWKTSMCFPAGCIIAMRKDVLSKYIFKGWIDITVVILGAISFIYIVLDSKHILPTQLIAFVCIASCIVVLWNNFGGRNRFFDVIGKGSLALYLVHIGVVDTIYALPMETNIKTFIFIGIVSVETVITYIAAEKLNRILCTKNSTR